MELLIVVPSAFKGSVDFGPEVTSSDKSLKVLLNAEDKVFNEIRNEHFSNVFGFLSQKARNLQAQYDVRPVPLLAFFSVLFLILR